jgi:Zn-dependent peptidase ImmA (M78 family)
MLHTEFDACTSSLEWQADFFSACLLMPRNLVIQKWQTYKSYSVQKKRVMLADFFRVSLEAMNIRIAHFKLI